MFFVGIFLTKPSTTNFHFGWISTSSKTPRACGHTRGCVLTWEYVCYKFQNFLRRESRVMAISVLNPVFSDNVAFHVLICLLFFPVRAQAQGSLCVSSLWLYTVGMSVVGWRINCDVKHVLFEKGLFQVTVCRPLVLLEKNA